MWVKVGDKVYNSKDQPIMVILTEKDKENIKNMADNAHCYCQYNKDNYTREEIFGMDGRIGWHVYR